MQQAGAGPADDDDDEEMGVKEEEDDDEEQDDGYYMDPRSPAAAAAAVVSTPGGGGRAGGTPNRRRAREEKERTKMRERQRRAITGRILAGLRQHGNYSLRARADINEVIAALAREAGWVVLPDGTSFPSSSSSAAVAAQSVRPVMVAAAPPSATPLALPLRGIAPVAVRRISHRPAPASALLLSPPARRRGLATPGRRCSRRELLAPPRRPRPHGPRRRGRCPHRQAGCDTRRFAAPSRKRLRTDLQFILYMILHLRVQAQPVWTHHILSFHSFVQQIMIFLNLRLLLGAYC